MASQVSIPATPQNNATYDAYMQTLQQKLSSISMHSTTPLGPMSPQTTFTAGDAPRPVLPNLDPASPLVHKLQIDSNPNSGTATTEMLSPVRDQESINSELSKTKNLTTLNDELSKINSRRDSSLSNHEEKHDMEVVSSPVRSKSETKIRKVSRFKVSVVSEPDTSKLVIPPDKFDMSEPTANSLNTTPVKNKNSIKEDSAEREIEISQELEVAKNIISSTMQQLQENLCTVNFQQGNKKSIL